MTRLWRFLDAEVKKASQRTKEAKDYVTSMDRQNVLKPRLLAKNLSLDNEFSSFGAVVEEMHSSL